MPSRVMRFSTAQPAPALRSCEQTGSGREGGVSRNWALPHFAWNQV